MANHKSAEKRDRQNKKRKMRNISIRARAKTSIKTVLKAVEEKDQENSKSALISAAKTIDKAAAKGVFHKNNASRKISRLTKKVNALG